MALPIKNRALIHIFTVFLVGILFACTQEESTKKSNKSSDATEATEDDAERDSVSNGSVKEDDTGVTKSINPDDVFLDTISGDAKAIVKSCSKDLGFKPVASKWPSKLKKFLAKELEKLPVHEEILQHVTGIYLMDTTTDEGFAAVAGVVCGADAGTDKVPVVLDLKMLTSEREKEGAIDQLIKYKTYEEGKKDRSYIVGDDGDYGLQTLIHELMHVYDLVYVPNSGDKDLIAAHKAANALAWKSLSEDRYGVEDKFGLTGFGLTEETSLSSILYECSKGHSLHNIKAAKSMGGGLGLVDFKRDLNDGELHKFLIEKTSFINQYSSTNRVEDFAETFTIYFSGTRFKDWSKRIYYDFDDEGNRSEIYDFSAKKVAETSKLHRKKMCAFAKYVLDEDCSKFLGD